MRRVMAILATAALMATLMLAALAPAAVTSPGGYAAYPNSVRSEFIKGCMKGGGNRAACKCTINKIQKRYSLKKFVKIAKRVADGGEFPAAIVKMAQACGKRYG
jgi:hypothetical protein